MKVRIIGGAGVCINRVDYFPGDIVELDDADTQRALYFWKCGELVDEDTPDAGAPVAVHRDPKARKTR